MLFKTNTYEFVSFTYFVVRYYYYSSGFYWREVIRAY